MKAAYLSAILHRIATSCALIIMGWLGFSSCRTRTKTTSEEPQQPNQIQIPIDRPIAMYGTIYQTYEEKELAPPESIITTPTNSHIQPPTTKPNKK